MSFAQFVQQLGETAFSVVLAVLPLVALFLLKWMPLRLALTPRQTKVRRVRRRAVELFRTAAEARTIGAERIDLADYVRNPSTSKPQGESHS